MLMGNFRIESISGQTYTFVFSILSRETSEKMRNFLLFLLVCSILAMQAESYCSQNTTTCSAFGKPVRKIPFYLLNTSIQMILSNLQCTLLSSNCCCPYVCFVQIIPFSMTPICRGIL